MEFQRLTSTFDYDTRRLEQGIRRAQELNRNYQRGIARGFQDAEREAGRSFQNIARQGEQALANVERSARTHASGISRALSSVRFSFGGRGGGSGSDDGGLFASLAKVIELVPGLNILKGGITGVAKAMTDGVRFGFDYRKMIEESTLSLTKYFGTAEKARKYIGELSTLRTEGLALEDALTGANRLLALGYAAKDIPSIMLAVADASRQTGADVDGITNALLQMTSKGKASMEELRGQLGERAVPVFKFLTDEIARTDKAFAKLSEPRRLEAFNKMVERGEISGRGAAETILRGFQREYGGAGRRWTSQTASGLEFQAMELLRERVGTAVGPAFEQGYKPILGAAVQGLESEGVRALSASAANLTAPLFGALQTQLNQLGFGAGSSFSEGIRGAQGEIYKAGSEAGGQLEKGVRDRLDQHSPSRVMEALGFDAGRSLVFGFGQGLRAQDAGQDIREVIKRVEEEFKRITGKKLPVVVGQTEFHTREGYEHSQGADIAFHPGSAEGRLVARILAGMGVPFRTFEGASRNAAGRIRATGPHIHAGRPSGLLDRDDAYVVNEYQGQSAGGAGAAVPVRVVNTPDFSGFPGRQERQKGPFVWMEDQRGFMDALYKLMKGYPTGDRTSVVTQADYRHKVSMLEDQFGIQSDNFTLMAQEHITKLLEAEKRLRQETVITARDVSAGFQAVDREVETVALDAVRLTQVFNQPLIPFPGVADGVRSLADEMRNLNKEIPQTTPLRLQPDKAKKVRSLTREGVAGDFQGSLSDLLSGIGRDGFREAGVSAALSFLEGFQRRLASDISSTIADQLFGDLTTAGKRTGGFGEKLSGWLGIGGKGATVGGDSAAVSVNTAATQANTLAVNQLTVAMSAGVGIPKGISVTGAEDRLKSEADFEKFFNESNTSADATLQEARGITSAVKGVDFSVNQQGFNVANAIHEQTNTMIALQPQAMPWWGQILVGALGMIGGGIASGIMGGGGPRFNDEGLITPRPTTPPVLKREHGGPVSAGTLYQVNEAGMEWFRPNVSGEVIPLGRFNQSMSNSNNRTQRTEIHHHYNITLPNPAPSSYQTRRSQRELAEMAMSVLFGRLSR